MMLISVPPRYWVSAASTTLQSDGAGCLHKLSLLGRLAENLIFHSIRRSRQKCLTSRLLSRYARVQVGDIVERQRAFLCSALQNTQRLCAGQLIVVDFNFLAVKRGNCDRHWAHMRATRATPSIPFASTLRLHGPQNRDGALLRRGLRGAPTATNRLAAPHDGISMMRHDALNRSESVATTLRGALSGTRTRSA